MPEKCVPAIPFPSGIDRNLERILAPIKETLDIWAGRQGDELCQVITLEDLLNSDITVQIATGVSGSFVQKAGDTMTGDLTVNANIGLTGNLQFDAGQTVDTIDTTVDGSSLDTDLPTAKAVYDYAEGAFVSLAGDTMTGKLHVNVDTGGVLDSTTVAAIFGDITAGQLDSVFITGNTINSGYGFAADGGSLRFNYRGYNGGASYIRDTSVYDGKGVLVASFNGTTKDFQSQGQVIATTNLAALNGYVYAEKDTGGVYDTTTISAIFGDSDSSDCVYFIGETLNAGYGTANDNAQLLLNYRGYNGGTTYFRDLVIANGKGGQIVKFDGSARTMAFLTGAAIDEFSIDGTMGGNSDTVLPTEKAIVTYVASQTVFKEDANGNIYGGTGTGGSLAGADRNFLAGINVAPLLSSGVDNILIGENTGRLLTTNYGVISIGTDAGYNNVASGNIFIGQESGYYNAGGSGNIVMAGYRGGYYNVTGIDNVKIGSFAGYGLSAHSHSNCTFIGAYSGYKIGLGSQNTGVGSRTIYNNEDGDYNVGIGYQAGYGVSGNSYDNCVFIGWKAGFAVTTATDSLCLGYRAGQGLTTGSYNVYLGADAGIVQQTSGYNVAIGYQALYGTLASQADYNVAIGGGAGYGISTGDNNLFAGYQAGYSVATGTGNVFLGYQAGYNETGSNKLYIANSNTASPLIHGDFSTSVLTINGTVNANADTDSTHIFGRAVVGFLTGVSDYAAFTHYDRQAATNYGFLVYAGGSTFMNSASGQICYIRSNNTSIIEASTGLVDVTGAITASGVITAASDSDTVHTLGRAKIGYNGTADNAVFAHFDNFNGTDFALRQTSAGATILNGSTAGGVGLYVNNVAVFGVNASGLIGNAGARITQFDSDVTMAANSATRGVTQSAAVGYVKGGTWAAYGEISVHDTSTTMSVSSSGWTQVTVFDTNGQSQNCTPDHTNDHITISSGYAGKYLATVSISAENSAGVGHVIECSLFKNNGATEFQNVHAHRTLGTGSDKGSISLNGIVDLSVSDTVELWIQSDSASSRNITVSDCTLTLVKIG